VLRHPDYTRDRINQLVQRIGERIYAARQPPGELLVSGPVERISHAEAQTLADFRPAKVGDQFRPLWATYWFRGSAVVPAAWAGARVDLLWDSQSEALLWLDGRSAQGLNMTQGDRPDAILLDTCAGGETVSFQIEMACNVKGGAPDSGAFPQGQEPVSPFVLRRCEIAKFDPQAWALYWDAFVLAKLEAELAKEGASGERSWQGRLLAELNRFANVLDIDDRATWAAGSEILRALYGHRNADRVMEVSVIGHAHIDTAWLWPLAETDRKCERTFSSAVAYMRDYPEYRFACSQAYQYDAIKRRNPVLYAEIKRRVAGGQFVPVGGTWVEPDCNIPSGEALCRQFLFGQRFFQQEFGRRCREFWNPDVFGYNGQLPQIMQQAGITRFLTHKLSWNRFNKPAHHTFVWRGLDGSEVLTHFPPTDTYNAFSPYDNKSEVTWLRLNALSFRDHDRAREALMLYGYGDGGGGPTKPMLEVLRRAASVQGIPPTTQRSSDDFFTRLEADCADRHVMVGELYFEYHRGTYTSQAMVKRNNRRAEQLLHDVEFITTVVGDESPRQEINALWELILLNQFHDILPGSSIGMVYAESARQYADLFARGERLLPAGASRINTTGFPRAEVVDRGGALAFVEAPAFGPGRLTATDDAVRFTQDAGQIVLENAHIRAAFSTGGRLVSLVSGRETLAGEANLFELYDDQPTAFDAWDIDPFHLETGKACVPAQSWKVLTRDPLRVEVQFQYAVGTSSTLTQVVRLDAAARRLEFHCEADWRESHKLLKVAFPVNVRAAIRILAAGTEKKRVESGRKRIGS